jgi:anti-sigma B factor antagonist
MAMTTLDQRAARLTFASAAADSTAVIRLTGELDLQAATAVENALLAAWQWATDVVVDVSGLTFCDCTGVGVFIRVAQHYEHNGGRLRLAAPQGIVDHLFAMLCLDDAIPIYASLTGAIANDPRDRLERHRHGHESPLTDSVAADGNLDAAADR